MHALTVSTPYSLLDIPYSLSSSNQTAADDEALDVVGALVDLGAAHAAIDALDAEVLDVAHAAQRLDRVGAYALGRLGGEQLGHGRLRQAGPARILEGGRVQGQLARGLQA